MDSSDLETGAALPAPAVLAYIGDAVFDLSVREHLVASGAYPKTQTLHRRTTALVCAPAQARMARALSGRLTPEEGDIMRRGRNLKTGRAPGGAEMAEYRLATGFEALLGFLYLRRRTERLQELVEAAIQSELRGEGG